MPSQLPFLIRVLRSRPRRMVWAALNTLIVGGATALAAGVGPGVGLAAVAFVAFTAMLEYVGYSVRQAERRGTAESSGTRVL